MLIYSTDIELGLLEGVETEEVCLKVSVRGLLANIWFRSGHEQWRLLAADIDLKPLSTEIAGGFVGCTVGMYASGNGKDTGGYADFSAFTYLPVNSQ